MMSTHLKKNDLVRLALLVVVLTQTAQITAASAEIFKCTNKVGKVFYNDKPCPALDDEKKMRSEKDVVNGYVPPVLKEEAKEREKGNSQYPGGKSGSVMSNRVKRTSKAENTPKSRSLSGGGGKRREKVAEEAGDEPVYDPKNPPKGNYADRAGTLEEKRIYLGIKRQVE